jgi:hypothetical protein
MKIKEYKVRLLTFEEQCMYEHSKHGDLGDEFLAECRMRLKNAGIDGIIDHDGEYSGGVYYDSCKVCNIRKATANEIFAHHYLQSLHWLMISDIKIETDKLYSHGVEFNLSLRELLKDKTIIVEGEEYAY